MITQNGYNEFTIFRKIKITTISLIEMNLIFDKLQNDHGTLN